MFAIGRLKLFDYQQYLKMHTHTHYWPVTSGLAVAAVSWWCWFIVCGAQRCLTCCDVFIAMHNRISISLSRAVRNRWRSLPFSRFSSDLSYNRSDIISDGWLNSLHTSTLSALEPTSSIPLSTHDSLSSNCSRSRKRDCTNSQPTQRDFCPVENTVVTVSCCIIIYIPDRYCLGVLQRHLQPVPCRYQMS
jgi:hypothetical protein